VTSPSARHGRRSALLAAAAVLLAAGNASATDPLNSNDKPANPDRRESPVQNGGLLGPATSEFNLVPIVGGNTDIGVGGGYFAGYTRLKPGFEPFLWSLESAALVTLKPGDPGGVAVPYADVFIKWTNPISIAGQPFRLEVRPSYTAETTILYYGLGNQVQRSLGDGKPASFTQFKRAHPALELAARFGILDHFTLRGAVRYVQNWLSAAPDSKLSTDMAGGSPEVRRLLGTTAAHAVLLVQAGAQWDTRDNEASTHRGALCAFDLKASPGGGGEFRYRYGEASLNLRAFLPLAGPRLTAAFRLVGNALFGDVPFYELSRFDDTYAIGGGQGVRGVPAGLFWGKAKLFGNVELRAEVLEFRAFGKALLFGVTLFLDAGRLWADYSAQPALDGDGPLLHYGAGGGLRLQSGSAFVLRADVAWSPDARPIGGYFAAGQLF
jgi:hypothetical protein